MNCWVEQEVADARMKDQRLKARLGQVLSQLSREPERSIPSACKQWGDVLGAYRFFDNDRVKFDDILSGHKAATVVRMADHQVILVAQDTTFLSCAARKSGCGSGSTVAAHGCHPTSNSACHEGQRESALAGWL